MKPRHAGLAAAALLALLALVVAAGFWGFSYDDAFITYRYARTLVEEGRLAYNPGPPTFGTTAPGFAVLLAGLSWAGAPVGLDVPAWGTLCGVGGLLAVPLVLILWRRAAAGHSTAGHSAAASPGSAASTPGSAASTPGSAASTRSPAANRRVPPFAPAVAALAGSLILLLQWNVEMLGGETVPATGLAAVGLWLLFSERRETAAGLAFAAAALLRLDFALAGAVAGLVWWLLRRRLPWRLLAAGAAPVAAALLALRAWFGQWLPDTLAAKQSELALATGTVSQAQWDWLVRTLGTGGAAVLLVLAAAGAVLLLAGGAARRPAVLATALWLLGHEAFYRLAGVPFAPWYHVPTLCALALLAGYAALAAGAWAGRRAARGRPLGRAAVAAAVALVLTLPLFAPSLAYLAGHWRRPPDPRWEVYHRAGELLRATSPPGAEVAAVEIGFLGWSSRRPVLDLMGLVSPGVAAARQQGRLDDLVRRRRPEYLLDVPLFRPAVLAPILADPVLAAAYHEAARIEAPAALGGSIRLLASSRPADRHPPKG